LLLDNEKGAEVIPSSFDGRNFLPSRQRAVLVGHVWAADLAEILMEVYSPLLTAGFTLEDVSRLVQETSVDRSGD